MEEGSIIIRPAGPGDAAGWIQLKQQIHHLHVKKRPERYSPITDGEAYEIFERLLQEEGTQVWVAQMPSGAVAGQMVIKTAAREQHTGSIANRYLLIDEICVDEKYRRCGIGRMLVDRARATAQTEGLDEITLFVCEFNQDALAFYKSIGMHIEVLRMSFPVKSK